MLAGVTEGVVLTGIGMMSGVVTVTGLYVGWMAMNPLITGGFESCKIWGSG